MATTPSTASAHDASEKNYRTPSASRQLTLRLASSTDDFKNRLVLTPRTNRVAALAALATPARKGVAAARGYGSHAALTPRQAAISARKQAEEQKKREGMLLRRQREETKNAAKAKHAAVIIHQQEMLRKRAETSQRQRKAAAAAKKTAREREIAATAKELQAKMRESREVQEYLSREAREKRRDSAAYQNAAWARERELKKKLHLARQEEEKMVMDGRNVFIEAKQRVREQRELTEKKERVWRARAKRSEKSEKTLRQRQGALAAHEVHHYRRNRTLDQAALEKEAAEEKRLRRGSMQWRRNEKMLELEIKRGSAEEALDAKRLADEVCLREEDRKAREREFVNARKVEEEYRCLQHMSRRLYRQEEEMRRKEQEAIERRIILEDRTSVLESKRKEEEAELDRREALREMPSEKTKLEILEAIWSRQAHPAAAAAARGRRRLRLENVEELTSSGLTASPEAHTSGESGGAGRVSSEANGVFGRSGCSGFHRDRDVIMSDSLSSSGSGMGIAGRLSVCGSLDSLILDCRERRSRGINDALMSPTSQSATALGGSVFSGVDIDSGSSKNKNLRVVTDLDFDEKDAIYGTTSSAPSWSDASVIGARGVTAEAAAVLAAAEQSFDSMESFDEAEAAAMASAAVGNWSPSSSPSHYYKKSGFFPLRASVFPGASAEKAQAEEEADQRVRGSAMDGWDAGCGEGHGVIPSGKYGGAFIEEAREMDESSVPGEKAVSSTMPITVDVLNSMDYNEDPSFLEAPSPAGSDVGDCEGDGFGEDGLF